MRRREAARLIYIYCRYWREREFSKLQSYTKLSQVDISLHPVVDLYCCVVIAQKDKTVSWCQHSGAKLPGFFCNYKGHSDHTLRTLFHTRHNGFISGVINTNCERCTGACRAPRNFPADQVQVKGAYTITGNSAQHRHTEYPKRKRHQRELEFTSFPSRNEYNKKDKQSQRCPVTMLSMALLFL